MWAEFSARLDREGGTDLNFQGLEFPVGDLGGTNIYGAGTFSIRPYLMYLSMDINLGARYNILPRLEFLTTLPQL